MTPKQRQFAAAYVSSQNARQAAISAGYSEQYAYSKAHKKLLENPEVLAEIKRLRARLNERADKSATDVVNEYSKIAFTDRVSFLKDDDIRPGEWMYKAPDELTDDQRALVEKVHMSVCKVQGVTPDGEPITVHRQEYRYVLADKANALQQMGRHFGIFDDKLRLGVAKSNPFANASPEQLEQLKRSLMKTINGVEYKEINK